MYRTPIIGLSCVFTLWGADLVQALCFEQTLTPIKTVEECQQEMPTLKREAQQHPNGWQPQEALAENLLCQNQVEAAVPILKRLPVLFPSSQQPNYYDLAKGLFRANPDDADVLKFLLEGIEADPELMAKSAPEKEAIAWQFVAGYHLKFSSPSSRLQKAQHVLEKAIQLDPKNFHNHQKLSQILAQTGQLDQAADTHLRFLKLSPSAQQPQNQLKAQVQVFLGKHHQCLGALQSATKAYQQAIALDANSFLAYYGLGEVHALNQDYQAAIKTYEIALNIEEKVRNLSFGTTQVKQAYAYSRLGKFLDAQDQWSDAAQAYEQELVLNPPEQTTALLLPALAWVKSNQPEKARLAYLKVLKRDQDFATLTPQQHEALSYRYLADQFAFTKDLTGWIEAAHKAFQLDPSLVPRVESHIIHRLDQDTISKTIALYENSDPLKITGYDWRTLAKLYSRQQNWDKALFALQQAQKYQDRGFNPSLSASPEAQAYAALGDLMVGESEHSKAIEAYRRALESLPESEVLHLLVGETLWDQGQPEEALKAFEKMLALYEKQPLIYNKVGILQMNRQNYPEAIAAFQRALELDPDYPEAQLNLKAAQEKSPDQS